MEKITITIELTDVPDKAAGEVIQKMINMIQKSYVGVIKPIYGMKDHTEDGLNVFTYRQQLYHVKVGNCFLSPAYSGMESATPYTYTRGNAVKKQHRWDGDGGNVAVVVKAEG
jgi:hypothetical protein